MTTAQKGCPACTHKPFPSSVASVFRSALGIGRWRLCDSCGYPLSVKDMLERLERERAAIEEALLFWTLGRDPTARQLGIEDALGLLVSRKRYLLPEHESEDLVVLSVENHHLIVNLGRPEAAQRYVHVFVGGA